MAFDVHYYGHGTLNRYRSDTGIIRTGLAAPVRLLEGSVLGAAPPRM